MKRLACLIVITILLLCWLPIFKIAHATAVNGNITADTEWTVADSPVVLNGMVNVASGSTLTIDPGVTVNLNEYSLGVAGTLTAIGTASNPIIFTVISKYQYLIGTVYFSGTSTNWNDINQTGSIIQNAYLNQTCIQISGTSPKIDSCYFNFSTYQATINVNGGSPEITNNDFVYSGQDTSHTISAISINQGSPFIGENEFDGNGYLTGIQTMSTNQFTVSENNFSNCWIGVKVQTSGGSLTVSGNTFSKCNDGLDVTAGAVITIQNNLIDGSLRYGINGGGTITGNTISNNQIGIHNPTSGYTITYNNIVGNSQWSITATKTSINAQNNWWGTTDIPTINLTIYDTKSDPSLGTVTFVPFLNGPNMLAPAIPATTPTLTPIPTLNPTMIPIQPTSSANTPVPTSTPTQKELIPTPTSPQQNSIVNGTGDLLNFNMITSAVTILLTLTWAIVICGYAAKSGITRYKAKTKKQN